jgi:hypothetical protein
MSSVIISYLLAVPFYILVERPFRNFLDLILFPKSSIFKKMKDVDDDDDDDEGSKSSDDDKSKNDDISDDDRDSIPKKARRGPNTVSAEIVCGYCIEEKCECRCLITKKRCKCLDKLD